MFQSIWLQSMSLVRSTSQHFKLIYNLKPNHTISKWNQPHFLWDRHIEIFKGEESSPSKNNSETYKNKLLILKSDYQNEQIWSGLTITPDYIDTMALFLWFPFVTVNSDTKMRKYSQFLRFILILQPKPSSRLS